MWRKVNDRLLEILSQVWDAVRTILCADAPEGYEIRNDGGEYEVDTKDLLSYCWRALKESRLARSFSSKVKLKKSVEG